MTKDYYKIKSLKHVASCMNVSRRKWDEYMEGAVKANGRKVRRLIKQHLPKLYTELGLNFHNPYECKCQRTKTHFIYVHSSIEYFLKVER